MMICDNYHEIKIAREKKKKIFMDKYEKKNFLQSYLGQEKYINL